MEISSPIEQVVRRVRAYRVLYHLLVHLRHAAVVELVPLVCRRILTISRIVTESHVAIVIGYGVQVVDELLTTMFRTDDVVGEVEALQRERHINVYFLPISTTTSEHSEVPTLLSSLLESLEVYNENRRCPVNFELFFGSYMLLTFVTIPHIIFIKNFSFLELLEAVINGNSTLLFSSLIMTTTINSLSLLHT